MLSKIQELQEIIMKKFNNKNNIQSDTISEEIFKLPISYIDKKYLLQENIKTDLELLPTNEHASLYNYILNPSDNYANKIIPMWSQYYSTSESFLKDTQYLLKNFKHISQPEIENINNVTTIIDEIGK